MFQLPDRSLRRRVARHLRDWGPVWLAALALLALSEAMWQWQTWPVRDLLGVPGVQVSAGT